MVCSNRSGQEDVVQLSVLALSSRFDGRFQKSIISAVGKLSVLALSSRFDGQRAAQCLHRFL